MSLISVSNLTFRYDGGYEDIFENVSLQLDTDWKLGFTGRNGRGKTTFLNLLLGKYEYSGAIRASVSFEYFPFEISDPNTVTIDVINSISSGYEEWELLRELSLLDVSEDALSRPIGTLSGGERTKVLLAALFLKPESFLLIDEPTNHLDRLGRETLSRYLSAKSGYILVSHDRAFLDGCVDHILSINKTDITLQRGNFSSWLTNKERQDAYETAENERLKKDVKRLKDSARRSADWADNAESKKIGSKDAGLMGMRPYLGEKSRKKQQQRKNLERRREAAISEKSSLLKNVETAEPLKISQLSHHSPRLVSLGNVSVYYDGTARVSDVSFTIEPGGRVSLQGRNGSGKTSLIKLICGEDITYTGDLYRAPNLIISYVSQDTSGLTGGVRDIAARYNIDESLFLGILRKLDFSRSHFDLNARDLSAGQKKKVLIAKSLCEKAHLHVWDEPLNYVDIYSRVQIEELIIKYSPTILFVEHDRVFSDKIATETVVL